jgi:thymidylate synthase (FAD)
MPKVTLIAFSPEPEKIVAASARLCYSDQTVDGLMEGLDEKKSQKFIQMLMDLGHESPIEHASFTFAVEGVSRSLLAQITRHRIASFSVQSQRYVNFNNPDFVIPPEIARNPEANREYLAALKNAAESYRALTKILATTHCEELLKQGVDKAKAYAQAEKMALEDARFVLPNATCTRMILTMNARSLMNFFHKRCCMRAQWEIREVANLMLSEVKKKAPSIFFHAGPPCITGPCPEGKMSCGKIIEMRKLYAGE